MFVLCFFYLYHFVFLFVLVCVKQGTNNQPRKRPKVNEKVKRKELTVSNTCNSRRYIQHLEKKSVYSFILETFLH